MESNGYNTDPLINPIDFYNIIMNNLDKFSKEDKFIILRFFDKLADSLCFSSICKSKLRYHVDKKDIKSKALDIFCTSIESARIEILKDVAYLNKCNGLWEFELGDKVILSGLRGEDALKIIKDVNSAFKGKKNKREDR